jgi:protein-arginine kinase activator protein McsA
MKHQAIAILEESIELLAKGVVSKDTAKAAVKGTVKEIIAICENETKEKGERVRALRSALELADKQIRELQKIAPAQEVKKESKKRTFKEKTCKQCGKTFTPHYGAQTLCDDCKDKTEKKTSQKAAAPKKTVVEDDIWKTARELAEMG